MYYCINCGVVVFLNRPDTTEEFTKPYVEMTCKVCDSEKGYRKVLPEFFRAANMIEFDRFQEKVNAELDLE